MDTRKRVGHRASLVLVGTLLVAVTRAEEVAAAGSVSPESTPPLLDLSVIGLRARDATAELNLKELGLDVQLGLLEEGGDPAADVLTTAGEPARDQTGTDPRDFSTKFMPYYRYVLLDNDIEAHMLAPFGMVAFTPTFAMTYEISLLKHLDFDGFGPFRTASGGIPAGNGFVPIPSGGTPAARLRSDGDETGVGDLILRFFANFGWGGNLDEENTWSIFPLLETTLPTATEDALGSDAWILSPGFTVVTDIPGPPPLGLGFFAMMNFFDFDVVKGRDRGETLRYRGRWFWMQPYTKPGPGLLDGLFTLIEMQPVYDFESSDFDFWVAPEFGKIVNEKLTIYGKPGWGIDVDPEDRQFSFEAGIRVFF